MSEILNLLSRGVSLYEKLVGVSRSKTTGTFRLDEFDTRRQLEDLDEALTLDPSGVTAVLLLRHFTESTVASKSFTFLDLLRKPELAQQLDLPREILSLVESPLISEAHEAFKGQLERALRHYDALDRAEVQALLADPAQLAYLRRDALRSIEKLRVDQFLDGAPEGAGFTPIYAKVVHAWWNINSLLENTIRLPAGVSLNLIREPDSYSSYFAFAIRNGGRIFVLSDIEPVAHPLQNMMSRRPDRTLERRMARNWFPYDLMNIKVTEDGTQLYIDEVSKCRSLAARQTETLPMQAISELNPESLVWTLMMFELIVEKFWRNDFRAPELSYTGEMVQHEAALLTAAKAAGLPAVVHQTLGLTPLTVEAVKHSDSSDLAGALGKTPDHPNVWMMERYGDQASEESINLLAGNAEVFLLGKEGAVNSHTGAALAKLGHFDRQDVEKSVARLHQLKTTAFGTKQQLDGDRIWLARYNWATQVQLAANKEFEERKDEVLAWFRERVRQNLPTLLEAVGHRGFVRKVPGSLTFGRSILTPHPLVVSQESKDFERWPGKVDPEGSTYVAVMHTKTREEYKEHQTRSGWWDGYAVSGLSDRQEPVCAYTGAKTINAVTTFYPLVAEDLAWMAGCKVADLPDVLQHFNGVDPYTGNSILSRIDPAASRLENPWLKLNLRVRIGTSKRGWDQAVKARTRDALQLYEPAPSHALT